MLLNSSCSVKKTKIVMMLFYNDVVTLKEMYEIVIKFSSLVVKTNIVMRFCGDDVTFERNVDFIVVNWEMFIFIYMLMEIVNR